MERRDFFRLGFRKTANALMNMVEQRVQTRSARWIRPPFALAELDFLLTCTRCDQCRDLCPHGVVFTLPARCGPEVAGTPALDLLHKGCHLCEGWPCVQTCQPRALRLPEPLVAAPRLARALIHEASCLPFQGPECGACATACPVPGALTLTGGRLPVIDDSLCTGCALCREACPVQPKAVLIRACDPPRENDDAA